MMGKDATKHQRMPKSCCEEMCYEPLSDVDRLAMRIPTMEVSSNVPCEKGESGAKV